MDPGQLLTNENLASRSARLAGQVLDTLLVFVAVIAAMAIAPLFGDLGALIAIGAIIAAVLYYLLADGLAHGQSIGKQMMDIAVVDATTGEPCTFGKSLVRNLFLSVLGIIDWLFIFGTKRQRLGDKAANTVVIKWPDEYNQRFRR